MDRQSEESVGNVIKNLENSFKSIDIRLLLIQKDNNKICNFAIIRLSNKDQQEITNFQNDILKISLKKNPNAEILFFSKPIMFINEILKDLEEGKIRYEKEIFQLKNNKSFPITSKVTQYQPNNNYWEYSSVISDEPNVLITLENQIGKYVFGCDNKMLSNIFEYDFNKYVCFTIHIPLYCLITKSDQDVKILIQKKLVNDITVDLQGTSTNGKPIYERVSLRDKVEKEDSLEEYLLDLSNFKLDDSLEQKLLVSRSVLDRIYEFKLNIPTIKETELNEWSKLEDLTIINQQSKNNFNEFVSQFIDIDTNTETYYLKDNFYSIQIFPKQRNDLVNYNFNDKYYKNLIFQINLTWKFGLFTSTFILCRKLIENLTIELLRKKFPSETDLYFNNREKRFHDFFILLTNLNNKKSLFSPDINEIDKIIQMAQPFRKAANNVTHHPFENPNEDNILKLKISEIVESILRIYKKTNTQGSMISYTL